MSGETIEVFTKRVLADADRIYVRHGGQSVALSALRKADRMAWVDRWFSDGVEPPRTAVDARTGASLSPVAPSAPDAPAPAVEPARPSRDAGLAPVVGAELWRGIVWRPLPGGGWAWANVEVPGHVVDAVAVGRRRQDTREVMTGEIIGTVGSWNLAKGPWER